MRTETIPEDDMSPAYARKRNTSRRSSGLHERQPAAHDERLLKPRGTVRKAVFPVAGLDTGLLPATKAAPKEMLTVVDKPLIHYAVEEAAAAGIREMIFVTNRNKRAIEDHFDMAYELETTLAQQDRENELRHLRGMFPPDVRYLYVRQSEYTGLGSALRCARPLVGDEPFALILPDELIDSETPAIAQLLKSFYAMHQPVVGVQRREPGDNAFDTLRTGASYRERTHHVVRFARDARSQDDGFVAAGRYVLGPSIFPYLERLPETGAAEVGLHDALQAMLTQEPILAYELSGKRFSCRTKLGLLSATVHFGLKHPELAGPFRELLRNIGPVTPKPIEV
ncbi:MAG: galU [Betaproteobacteria bacterium]|jgi:UTP--glucose-1-phosphate uridylyltransferase|nr:galU [Betaproteobacteria bacterium]